MGYLSTGRVERQLNITTRCPLIAVELKRVSLRRTFTRPSFIR